MHGPISSHLDRRQVLQFGGLSALCLADARISHAIESPLSRRPRLSFGSAKQVIMLYLHGGHPQQETFDPKPNGPVEVRGEFAAIQTKLPGVLFGEHLPKSAAVAHQLAIVRSMSHGISNHVQASLPANTGHQHPPGAKSGDFPPSNKDFPPFGAVISHVGAPGRSDNAMPQWVRIGPLMRRSNGTVLHGQLPGLLGVENSSFVVDQKLTSDQVRIDALSSPKNLPALRLSDRHRLQQQFNQLANQLAESANVSEISPLYQRACELLTAAEIRKAFQLSQEKPATRERYGKTEFGQRCLLARRLAEAGVPVINVSYCHTPAGSWDTHSQNFKKIKTTLGPTFDTAFSALIEDLDQRGMLDQTLVVVNAEFGRTPKINKNSGRDHWPSVYSLCLAGAGVRPGVVHGKSDKSAAYPQTDPTTPADFAATVYHLLGIPADTVLHDRDDRPHRLVVGRPIESILS